MTSYRTKYRVYFKRIWSELKLLGISKTNLIGSWKNSVVLNLKKQSLQFQTFTIIFLIGISKKNSIKVLILLAMMALYKFF